MSLLERSETRSFYRFSLSQREQPDKLVLIQMRLDRVVGITQDDLGSMAFV